MERDIHLHLNFSYEPRALRPWMAAALLLLAAGDLASESVTLTTYYPAPSGVYTQMITTGQTLLARDGTGRVGIGLGAAGVPTRRLEVTGYSADASAARITSASSSSGVEIDVTASGSASYYALNAHGTNPYLYVRGDGFVGVGTNTPGAITYTPQRGQMLATTNISVGAGAMAGGTNPYVYVNANGGFCNDQTTNNFTCNAGRYITWTPGIYTASNVYYSIADGRGWWSTGPNIRNTTVITNVGPQYSIVTTAPRYFCCQK